MSDVQLLIDGAVGRIRLNRPKALHALNRTMCENMLSALERWRTDAAVEIVSIDHAEGRGFCAGGDIRMLADSGAGDGAEARAFFAAEYRLNHALFTYAKPTIAFMDGVTMGGGVGIAMPCRFRVATENTRLAMPETGIGLFPDVGGGWYLSRLPGRLGQYIALTGYRLDGAECLALGLATHYLPAASLDEAKRRIARTPQEIGHILDVLAETPGAAKLLTHREDINRLFAADALEDVFATLQADTGQANTGQADTGQADTGQADTGEWAAAQLATLRTKSPLSMKVSLRLLHEGAAMPTFEDEMRQEFAVATRMVQRHDFTEGVRAVIVDKDNAPRWEPATPDAVSDHVVDQIFAPLDDGAWAPV